jgi:hypothetical protein
MIPLKGEVYAQCYGALALAESYFEFDYLVRLAVHFGNSSDLPDNIVCCRAVTPGESPIEVPVYAYNLHEGITSIEFTAESNDSIADFIPAHCFCIHQKIALKCPGYWRIDLKLCTCEKICGPELVGHVVIIPVSGADPLFVDLVPNRQTHKMLASDVHGGEHNAFSPHHGGYIGDGFMYACQDPICEEPNSPVLDFDASMGHVCAVRLAWRAGGGNRTVIRYRTDRYPTGYEDGELAVEIATEPGRNYLFYHTHFPTEHYLYYKAFSISRDAAGNVVNNSFVECSSVDCLLATCLNATDESSWGGIKKQFNK